MPYLSYLSVFYPAAPAENASIYEPTLLECCTRVGPELFKAYLVVLLSDARMRDRFSLSSLTPCPSLDLYVYLRHFDISYSLFSSPLFPYLYVPLSIPFAEATMQFRVNENENIGEKMTQEKRKVAVRTRYLRRISHEVDPVLNIDEFALDGISSGTKNKH